MSTDPVPENAFDNLFEEDKVNTRKKDKKGNWITQIIRRMVRSPIKCVVCGRPLKRNNRNQITLYCSKMCKSSLNKKGKKKLAKLKVQVEQRRKRDENKRLNDSEERRENATGMSGINQGC